MSKNIVNLLVQRAMVDTNRRENEAKMPTELKTIQDRFYNDPLLAGNEALAAIVELIIGFRPRTTNQKIVPFEVFEVMSKAEQRVIQTAICLAAGNGTAFGCTGLNQVYVKFEESVCRVAAPADAKKFIEQEVAGWEDGSLLLWINSQLGAASYPKFFNELERTAAPTMVKK